MDITATIAPKSDQANADDLVGGPITVRVIEVTPGTSEQPVNIITDHFGPDRPYKPGKSMRRVLAVAWGKETDDYAGRRMTLYCDPSIKFGGENVGGIRISHMSHIDKPVRLALTVARGKKKPYIVDPLPDERDWAMEIASATTEAELQGIYQGGCPKEFWRAIAERKAHVVTHQPEVIHE